MVCDAFWVVYDNELNNKNTNGEKNKKYKNLNKTRGIYYMQYKSMYDGLVWWRGYTMCDNKLIIILATDK